MRIRLLVLIALCAMHAPAVADEDSQRRHADWRDHERIERQWREDERSEHPGYFVQPPVVVTAPPVGYGTPPPYGYAAPPPPGYVAPRPYADPPPLAVYDEHQEQ